MRVQLLLVAPKVPVAERRHQRDELGELAALEEARAREEAEVELDGDHVREDGALVAGRGGGGAVSEGVGEEAVGVGVVGVEEREARAEEVVGDGVRLRKLARLEVLVRELVPLCVCVLCLGFGGLAMSVYGFLMVDGEGEGCVRPAASPSVGLAPPFFVRTAPGRPSR